MVCIVPEEENKIPKTVIYFTTPTVKRRRKKKFEKVSLNNSERERQRKHIMSRTLTNTKINKGHLDLELQCELT